MTSHTLPPAVRKLCGQVAQEELRGTILQRAAELRADALRRLADGEPVGSVEWPSEGNPEGTRSETYEQTGPDGTVYTVTHNYDTGVTTKVTKA